MSAAVSDDVAFAGADSCYRRDTRRALDALKKTTLKTQVYTLLALEAPKKEKVIVVPVSVFDAWAETVAAACTYIVALDKAQGAGGIQ